MNTFKQNNINLKNKYLKINKINLIKNSFLTFITIYEDIKGTATDINMSGYDIYTGYGLLNVSLLIEVISDFTPPTINQEGLALTISDNVGIYKINGLSNDYTYQGQKKIKQLQIDHSPITIKVEDLAGNIKSFTTTAMTHKTASYSGLSTLICLFMLVLTVRRRKRK